MLVCHRHRFIFVKTAKTAGSSVELFLRQFCDADDIVTGLNERDETIAASLGVGPPRNHGRRPMWPWEIRRRDMHQALRRRSWPRHRPYYHHQSAGEIRTRLGDDMWNEYRKITIVRDPWDTTVSRYHWRSKRRAEDPVAALDEAVERAGTNRTIYTIDDEVAVDTVMRYETLQSDLDQLTAELGVTPRYELPGAKTGVRPPRTPAHEVLSIDQARRVAAVAHREIETFGYVWQGPVPL